MTAPSSALRVAIVGAGPAGIYAGDILANSVKNAGGRVVIDLIESLPAPYGLIRYGVAPDHPRIKGIVNSLHEMLDRPSFDEAAEGRSIRFLGNIEVGRDISLDELRARYHAVIFATGAVRDAHLTIPGVELDGSYGAADFVSWFDGHPDVPRTWPLTAQSVAVIGNGNVALDVARVLAKHAGDLRSTEVPDNVLEGLAASAVTDVHVFGRRGPADIKFTPIELRELGDVPDVDIVLYDEDFDGVDATAAPTNQLKVMLRTLNAWRATPTTRAPRRLHLHFWHSPVEIIGDDKVEAMRFERTRLDDERRAVGTGEFVEYAVQAVYRAVGYFGSRVVDAPFDESRGVIPNEAGRVGSGLYATGWIKRGPVGLIGHTKSDAAETIANLLADYEASSLAAPTMHDDITELLAAHPITTWEGWLALDAHERGLGETHEYARERVKVVPRDEQVTISATARVLAQ